MQQNDIVIVGAARTPVGAYLGDLKTVPVEELGRIALQGAIARAGLEKEEIQEVVVGHVTGSQTTNNLGRIIGINSGLPNASTGYTVNRICGSGIQSAINAVQQLQLVDDLSFVAAGGAETLSRAEYYLPANVRYEGMRAGDFKVLDANDEGHRTASGYPNKDITHMGITAENVVAKYQISRQQQDQFAYESQMKAKAAMESGRFAQEIIPVEVPGKKGAVTIVSQDGHPRPGTTLEALAQLKPVFKKDGTVTAGNASGMNDGAAFEIFTKASVAQSRGLSVMAQVMGYAVTGCDPRLMGLGPVGAITKVLAQSGLQLADIDILEINEAFAGQVLGCLHELNIPVGSEVYHRLNPNGGAVALGHPLGMSGARILTSICYEFRAHPEKRYAIASACIGGGMGIAMLLQNPAFTQ